MIERRKRIALVVCLHGDEQLGLDALAHVSSKTLALLDVVVGNPVAVALSQRFVETDLNRSFPGSVCGSIEERLAARLVKQLSDYDVVVDVHTTSAQTKPFVIVTSLETTREFIGAVPLTDVVVMPRTHGVGRALIDYVKGFSLEFQETCPAQEIGRVLDETVQNIISEKQVASKKIIYRGVGTAVFNKPVPNFEIIKDYLHEGKPVYAILSGARSYAGKTILAMRGVNDM